MAVHHPAARALRDPLAVSDGELWGLSGLIGFYLLAGLIGGQEQGAANFVGPLCFTAVLFFGAIRAMVANTAALWTGLFWMRVASGIYFGVGSVVHDFLNDHSLGQLLDFHAATEDQIAKFNLIAALSVFTILVTVRILAAAMPMPRPRPAFANDLLLLRSGLFFAGTGYSVKYLLVFPQAMGVLGPLPFQGLLAQVPWLAPVGLFLLAHWVLKCRPQLFPFLVALALADSLGGALRFSKTDALLPLLMVFVALLMQRITLMRIALVGLLSITAFQSLQPAVGHGRAELFERYGTLHAAGFGERLSILGDYLRYGPDERHDDFQGALIRIAYVHAAAPAIALHDAGMPGTSLAAVPVALIPRLLWPGKPSFNQYRDYTIQITGLDTSATWMGYFGEAYWNLGWLGIPVVMMPLGLVFFLSGRYAAWVIAHGRWTHFPSVFLGMFMGVRVDGMIALDVAAIALAMVIVYPCANLLANLLEPRRRWTTRIIQDAAR